MRKFSIGPGNPRAICKRLISLRREQNLTLMNVAERFEANKSTVSRWESEHHWRDIAYSVKKRHQLLKLAEYYKADNHWLLTGKRLKENEISDILIVDDQNSSLLIISLYLQSYFGGRFNAKTFTRAEAALNWANTHEAALVICDYRMPGMNGDQFIRELKSLAHYQNTPIFSLTLYDDPEVKAILMEAGANEVLYKPFNDIQLSTMLTRL